MPGSILDVMFQFNLIEHGKVNLCYPGCKQLQDFHILRSKIMLAHIEQQAPHATSEPPAVGQWTTFKSCYFRIELAFQCCMKIHPCYYAVSAHLAHTTMLSVLIWLAIFSVISTRGSISGIGSNSVFLSRVSTLERSLPTVPHHPLSEEVGPSSFATI